MTTVRGPGDGAAADAARELASLRRQIETVRVELKGLRADVASAEQHLGSQESVLLLRANERLILSALQAQNDAVTAALALDEAARSAEHDALTGLANRALLRDRLTQAIAVAKRQSGTLAVLFIDLDLFKEVNDTFGHRAGDATLKRVARCLRDSVRESDTVSRHGGDEFVILLADVAQAADAQRTCEAISLALQKLDLADEHPLQLSASIGISHYPGDGIDATALIELADAAMYRAKERRLAGNPVSRWELASDAPLAHQPRLPVEFDHATAARRRMTLAAHELRSAQQRSANEQLLLAALGAQGLQADAERAQRRQTDFMTMLAHELRNPLAPLRAAATLLGRVHSQEPLMLRLQAIIERQVVNMSRLVNDLLDVSRAKTGKLRLECAELDFSRVLGDAVDTCRTAIDARRQRFEVDVPNRPIRLVGDALRLAQIVGNVLDNASKYTPNGGTVTLRVTLGESSLVMDVADTGIGITAETLQEVFEPFVQDAHAIGFNGTGLGIGLTVVRELVEAHGGTVTASSPGPHLGSRFVVTLPRVPDEIEA